MKTPPVTALTVPTNCPRAMRIALALQQNPDPLPTVPTDIDAVLLPFLPDHGHAAQQCLTPAISPDRSTLQAPDVITERTEGQKAGGVAVVTFQLPGNGEISRVEGVLWPQMGLGSVRACMFLYTWLKLGYFKEAVSACKMQTGDVWLWRDCSDLFRALYDGVDSKIKQGRHAQAEDTLHKLANGDLTEPVFGAIGGGMSGKVGEKAIYSEKALLTELSAGDPKRYGKAQGAADGLSITINLQLPDASGPTIEAEEIEIEPDEIGT